MLDDMRHSSYVFHSIISLSCGKDAYFGWGVVGVVEDVDALTNIAAHEILHAFCKWAGIADRCAFGDAGCENDGISALTDEAAGPQDGFFAWTAAAVDEACDIDRFVGRDIGEDTGAFADGFEIEYARAIVSGLVTADDAHIHDDLPPFSSDQ